ncbi:MAG: class C beta-lactamase-related serine hydrolase [Actinobacteria bacterium]|nr:class C beta-lactamase-related serine hydrolase [Actinomycetota bacterium]
MFKFLKRTVATLLIIYLALFGLTKAIRYPEPIAAIKLGLAPASKTPDLMPSHIIEPADTRIAWATGSANLPKNVNYGGTEISLEKFIDDTETNAFLVIKDGKLVFEKYYNGKSKDTLLPTYSVAKTLTSIMIGQLITAGKLKESDTFVSILPEYKAGTDFDLVTIRDLLDMNSGIGVSDNYPTGPSGWGVAIAQMYASTDLYWWLHHNQKMWEKPGTKPEYRSINTQLLGMVIAKLTGETVSEYFQKNVWQPIGAQSQAKWNVDHVGGIEKTFCCFNATARDFARVGQLFVNNGAANIGGGSVISASYLKRMSTPVVTLDYNWGYSAQTWHPFPDSLLLLGLHGQYIYVQPKEQVVIVKLSDLPTSADGISEKIVPVLQQIASSI